MTTVAPAPSGQDLSLCIPDLKSRRKEAALAEMALAAHDAGVATDPDLLLELLRLRERLGSTGVGKGVALPQARSVTVLVPRVIVARAPRGIDWAAEDGIPANLLLLALAPAEWPDESYHGLIVRAASVARLQRSRQRLLDAPSTDALAGLLREVLP